jgi:hypothetical protein
LQCYQTPFRDCPSRYICALPDPFFVSLNYRNRIHHNLIQKEQGLITAASGEKIAWPARTTGSDLTQLWVTKARMNLSDNSKSPEKINEREFCVRINLTISKPVSQIMAPAILMKLGHVH